MAARACHAAGVWRVATGQVATGRWTETESEFCRAVVPVPSGLPDPSSWRASHITWCTKLFGR